MAYNMKELTEAGRDLLQKDLRREFDESDLIQLLAEKDRTEAITSALRAGYALGHRHGTQDAKL